MRSIQAGRVDLEYSEAQHSSTVMLTIFHSNFVFAALKQREKQLKQSAGYAPGTGLVPVYPSNWQYLADRVGAPGFKSWWVSVSGGSYRYSGGKTVLPP